MGRFLMQIRHAVTSFHFVFFKEDAHCHQVCGIWRLNWRIYWSPPASRSSLFVLRKSAHIMAIESMELRILLNSPAMAAPPGMQHNFVNPANLNAEGYAAVITCLAVSVLAVGIRMWTKVRLVRKVLLEDCNFISFLFKYSWTWWLTISGICCLTLVLYLLS